MGIQFNVVIKRHAKWEKCKILSILMYETLNKQFFSPKLFT